MRVNLGLLILLLSLLAISLQSVNADDDHDDDHHDEEDDDDELSYADTDDDEWVDHYQQHPSTRAHHEEDGEHNEDYDHEAFLGVDEAEEADHLSIEEARNVLLDALDKADTSGDGYITINEMIAWLELVRQREINETVQNEWILLKPPGRNIAWEFYKNQTWPPKDLSVTTEKARKHEEKEQKREKKRWDVIDIDRDGLLTPIEFGIFLHPEESNITRRLIASEILADFDKDNDTTLNGDEYSKSLHHKTEPDFLQREADEKRFKELDKDNNGKLDINEIDDWIFDDNAMRHEAEHLIKEADEDEDGTLSFDEAMDNYHLFVNKHRVYEHDEL